MLPMLAFIPWLASVFALVVGWFAKFFAQQWALKFAAITLIISITIGFTLAINGLIYGLVVTAPSGWYKVGISLLPTNYTGCLGAYLAAHVTRWVYDYHAGFTARWINAGL